MTIHSPEHLVPVLALVAAATAHVNDEVAKLGALHGEHWQRHASPTLLSLYRALEAL